nr:DNA (cytosine-5-)-methyltransferase (TIGR00675) [uncultured Mediterranean phage uvMED]
MERKLKVLDLFAGIGGFALGLDSTDFFETVKFVEKDKYCQKVLQKNFPNIPIEEDIKNVKGKEGDADVIVGGFPCQPMSVAGKRKGTDDDRYLWPDMFRLIREIKPQFVIGENVQGIINIQDGMVLRQVCDDLESEGFEVQCFLIPASGIGAWHQRYRVWIVGHSEQNGYLNSKRGVYEKKNKMEREYREENSATGKSIRASAIRKTNNGYENVSNTDTRLSIGENEEIQTRRDTVDSSSSRGGEENVSNTEIIGTRESRNIDQEKRNEGCSPTQSNSSSEDVSNTNESLRGGGRTISLSGENKVWGFRVEEEGIRDNVRIETVGRDALSRKGETNVSQSNNERRKESDISQKSEKQIFNNRGHDEKEHGSNSEGERSQGHGLSTNMEGQSGTESTENSVEKQYTWWQTESNLCGVPNGISYELDKNRANRIKTLGNAIVPQIARELGLAIKKVVSEDII